MIEWFIQSFVLVSIYSTLVPHMIIGCNFIKHIKSSIIENNLKTQILSMAILDELCATCDVTAQRE